MVMWVFGYGSLIWKAGFHFDDRLVGFIKDYRRVFYQGSTDHRGTPEYPGRTVTLETAPGQVCWGVAYKVSSKEDQQVALTYLEVREKQYDKKEYIDFFTDVTASSPAISGVMVYIASPDKVNCNYLGPASVEEIAKQIVHAEGPSGPNSDYLFNLEKTLLQMGTDFKFPVELGGKLGGLDNWTDMGLAFEQQHEFLDGSNQVDIWPVKYLFLFYFHRELLILLLYQIRPVKEKTISNMIKETIRNIKNSRNVTKTFTTWETSNALFSVFSFLGDYFSFICLTV